MSGSPSFDEIEAQASAITDVLETFRKFADDTMIAKLTAVLDLLEGDYTPTMLSAWCQDFRAGMSALLDPSFVRRAADAIWLEFAKQIGKPARNPSDAFGFLRQHMQDNTIRLETRAITHDTTFTAGGSNVGDGGALRLTVDENNDELEAMAIEAKLFECVVDENAEGGIRHAETFRVEGEDSSPDWLQGYDRGSGLMSRIVSLHSGTGEGGSLLRNSSFTDHDTSDPSSTTKVSGWVIDTPANIAEETSAVFRTHPGQGTLTSKAIDFTGNAEIQQDLEDAGIKLNPRWPYLAFLRWRRESSADGTLSLSMGSHSGSVDVTTGTNDQWNLLTVAINQNCWYENFKETDLDIAIALASNTTGNVVVDDVYFGPWTLLDGTFWALYGGATPWSLKDTLTVTDTGGDPHSGGENQYHLCYRTGYGHLPHTAAGTPPEWTDPS